ncbi:anthranilate synthase component I family protein [Aequorivita sp. SDUM287046]|uniref:Anthranilate synthase component I family protein n=1 Tax=Aequorivita aurantiaca TaxID=3053356 RepID=A0ABT8DJH2_9FLAO|nr:anthranilate synthase component I family protein [Aequorivita aurantiaca]MDN3724071.1 anthranilate synthase component I family protein [Aequorivita aurantiaca]
MRTVKVFSFPLTDKSKNAILQWSRQFSEVVWLDGNNYSTKHCTFQAVLAVDAFTALKTDSHNAFQQLHEYQSMTADWIFGYVSYDLKNDVENLHSNNFDGLNFPDLYFFQPKKLFLFYDDCVEVHYLNMVSDEMDADLKLITEPSIQAEKSEPLKPLNIQSRTSRESYIQKVENVLEHIRRGNIYEVNICQEFFCEEVHINPLETFIELNRISKPPFSTFLQFDHLYVLCASPERYIKKLGHSVISQPIKGTAKRSKVITDDLKLAQALAGDPKERSENIMITDLVRNDLSRIAEKGSVSVLELCSLYTFEQVHQLISTVHCSVSENTPSVEILKQTFPMGSMTGAPKIAAMQIIEETEDAKRGIYSGSIGYFSPASDFDFNVVIRSILYNSDNQYISFSVGSAITINSTPEKEYEECLLKAQAMRQVLKGFY